MKVEVKVELALVFGEKVADKDEADDEAVKPLYVGHGMIRADY